MNEITENTKSLKIDQIDWQRREKLALSRLTDKQKLFCEEYVRSFDKIKAMKAGGYALPKHTTGGAQRKLIEQNFEKIMSSEAVQEYILLLKQDVASRLGVSVDDIIDEYKLMAFANIEDYVEWDKNGFTKFKDSKKLTRAQKAGILEITETTTVKGTTIKIKLHPKQPALDRLFEILKELEEFESSHKGQANISQTQINVMLGDPLMRRAIELIATKMFPEQIKLVGVDKNQIEFNKHLDKIMHKLEATSGRKGTRSFGEAQLPAPESTGGKEKDGGNPAEVINNIGGKKEVSQDESCGAAAADTEPADRYDFNGIRPVS